MEGVIGILESIYELVIVLLTFTDPSGDAISFGMWILSYGLFALQVCIVVGSSIMLYTCASVFIGCCLGYVNSEHTPRRVLKTLYSMFGFRMWAVPKHALNSEFVSANDARKLVSTNKEFFSSSRRKMTCRQFDHENYPFYYDQFPLNHDSYKIITSLFGCKPVSCPLSYIHVDGKPIDEEWALNHEIKESGVNLAIWFSIGYFLIAGTVLLTFKIITAPWSIVQVLLWPLKRRATRLRQEKATFDVLANTDND